MTEIDRLKLGATARTVLGVILSEGEPICLQDIAAKIDKSVPTVSRHVETLRRAHLVETESRVSPTGKGRQLFAYPSVTEKEDEPRTLCDKEWPSRVSPLQRDVYAAILELAPDASYAALTEYLQVQRGTVNVACNVLAEQGVIYLQSDRSGETGRRQMSAFPVRGVGAEQAFRAYRLQHSRAKWLEHCPPAAERLYKILYAYGPLTRRQVQNHSLWSRERSQLGKALVALAEVGAIDYSSSVGPTGRPCRLYRARRGDIGPVDMPQEKEDGPRPEWASEPYTPPTTGRSRYRRIGRGRE